MIDLGLRVRRQRRIRLRTHRVSLIRPVSSGGVSSFQFGIPGRHWRNPCRGLMDDPASVRRLLAQVGSQSPFQFSRRKSESKHPAQPAFVVQPCDETADFLAELNSRICHAGASEQLPIRREITGDREKHQRSQKLRVQRKAPKKEAPPESARLASVSSAVFYVSFLACEHSLALVEE
jgi:hypothetical protein